MVTWSKCLNFHGISVVVYNIKTDFHTAINHKKISLFLSIYATYFSHTNHPQTFKYMTLKRNTKFVLEVIKHSQATLTQMKRQIMLPGHGIYMYHNVGWGWGTSKHNCLVSHLLCLWRHVSAIVGHLQITKIYIEENYTEYDSSIGAYSKLSTRSRCQLYCTYWANSTSSK